MEGLQERDEPLCLGHEREVLLPPLILPRALGAPARLPPGKMAAAVIKRQLHAVSVQLHEVDIRPVISTDLTTGVSLGSRSVDSGEEGDRGVEELD